jgi:outer membrane protein OmpA-like peptidoglycan-associated protein
MTMTTSTRFFRWAALPAVLWVAGCASAGPPPQQIQQAQLAIQDARDAGADSVAPETVQAASDHLALARRSWNDGHEAVSLHYARLADSEAREARARARSVRTQQELTSLRLRKAQLEAQLRETQTRLVEIKADAAARAQQEQARLEREIAAREAERRNAEERERTLREQLDAERQKAAEQQKQAEIDRLSRELEAQRRAAEEAIQAAEREKAALETARRTEEARRQAAEQQARAQTELLVRLQQIEKSARSEARGIVLTLPGNVYFATGRSDLQPGIRAHLAQIAGALATAPDRHVLIEGHTDSTGRAEFNMKLSQLRAESVKAVLIGNGVSPDRIEVHGYGATKPLADNKTPAGRSQNRRVEIVVQATPSS